jgi:hypothetical protein
MMSRERSYKTSKPREQGQVAYEKNQGQGQYLGRLEAFPQSISVGCEVPASFRVFPSRDHSTSCWTQYLYANSELRIERAKSFQMRIRIPLEAISEWCMIACFPKEHAPAHPSPSNIPDRNRKHGECFHEETFKKHIQPICLYSSIPYTWIEVVVMSVRRAGCARRFL